MQEVKLPQLGQSVEEAAIIEWFKQEGDAVEKGERLFSIQTDKAEIECESTATGVLRKILVEPDIEVPVMTVVALVGEAGEALPDLSAYEVAAGEAPAAETQAPTEAKAAQPAAQAPAPASVPGPLPPKPTEKGVSPRARVRAEALNVPPELADGTGAGGRVIEEDVVRLAEAWDAVTITPTARRMAIDECVDVTRVTGTGRAGKITKDDVAKAIAERPAPGAGAGGRVPLTPMRRIIAERMVESLFSAPHYYMTVEVDMTAAVERRASGGDFRPSFNDLVLFATAKALHRHPAVNARWDGDAIEEMADVNLGFAVALPAGLVVPVIRQIQRKTLRQVHDEARALGTKAQEGKLTPDDYSGSTFTISNLGAFGVDEFTAIINQPNSAILAVGQVKDRAVVLNGGIHVRPIMKLTLSSDHRVIDGAVAAQFMGALREILETGDF